MSRGTITIVKDRLKATLSNGNTAVLEEGEDENATPVYRARVLTAQYRDAWVGSWSADLSKVQKVYIGIAKPVRQDPDLLKEMPAPVRPAGWGRF